MPENPIDINRYDDYYPNNQLSPLGGYGISDSNHRWVTDLQIDRWDDGLAGLSTHIGDVNNPHQVTKQQVGLSNVQNVDTTNASNITFGTLSLSIMPPGVMERIYVVSDIDTMYSLTITDIQNGDVVKLMSNGQMYYVKDDTNLDNASGYEMFTAEAAAAVDWYGILNKPTTLGGYGITDAAPLSHIGSGGSSQHPNATTILSGFMSVTDKIKLDGIATNATLVSPSTIPGNILVNGVEIQVISLGTTMNTACAGNDLRLSDSRTPTAHATTHVTGGSDVIPNVISSGASGLMTGADKLKLDGISELANRVTSSLINGNIKVNGFELTVYTLPSTLPATMITQDSTHRMVTDTQIATWSAGYAVPNFKRLEIPTGNIDGINTEFFLNNVPIADQETVYLGGLPCDPSDMYTVDHINKKITMAEPPIVGQSVMVSYFY